MTLERQLPDRVVATMAKQRRAGRVFVDWAQNHPTKTTIAAYSLRAMPEPTVSTPVTWDEVEDARDARARPDVHGGRRAGAREDDPFAPVAHAPAGAARPMLREFSAGGVVIDGRRELAVIRPAGPAGRATGRCRRAPSIPGERDVDAAVREVLEETGLVAEPVRRLEPVKYVYQRDGERIFKVVTFWVMAPVGGELGAITEEMRVEVAEAAWVPLADAPRCSPTGASASS